MAVKGMTEFRSNGEDFTINDPNIADEFSASKAYAEDDCVYYQGTLFRFVTPHAAGTWDRSHVAIERMTNDMVVAKDIRDDIKDIATNNIIIRSARKKIVTAISTWSYQSETYKVPDGTKSITVHSEVSADSGTAPTTRIKLRYLDSSKAYISDYNVTQDTAVITIPNGTAYINIWFYTNNGTAANKEVIFSNLLITADSRDVITDLQENVRIKGEEIGNVFEESKNLFTASFERGSINTDTGNYGATPSGIHNSATEKWMEVDGNMMYSIGWDWNPDLTSFYLFEYKDDGTYIGRTTIDGFSRRVRYITFTTNVNTKYVRFMTYSSDNTEYDQVVPKNVQLEMGGISTPSMDIFDFSRHVDYEKTRNAKLTVPDYYFAGGYLQNKVEAIRQLMFDAEGDYDAFVFITDTHWEGNQQKSMALIRYLKKAMNINKVFHGGDMYDKWSQYYHDEMLRELESAHGTIPYSVAGNHEYKGSYMDDPQIWYFLNSMHMDIVPGNVSRNYYYMDNKAAKTRYVILNSFATDNEEDAQAQFESAQKTWLQNTALEVESGWRIVIFVHAMYNIVGANRALSEIEGVTTEIESVLDNYDGNGKIICVIQGHTHIDRITSTTGGIPVIITTCDKNAMWVDPETGIGDLSYTNRVSGTITEQAFDVFVIDYKHKKISAVRIGDKAFNGIGDNMGTQVEMRQVTYS